MLSHAKTEMDVVKELASNDKAYRSLTLSWFKNSPLLEMIQQAQQMGFKLIITTDHGTINCKNPSKVIGDKNTSLNLRYKTGRSLTYEDKDVYAIKDPKKFAEINLFLNNPEEFKKWISSKKVLESKLNTIKPLFSININNQKKAKLSSNSLEDYADEILKSNK